MRKLQFGYNTNGFAHHRLYDAIEVMATLGYSSIALTLDVCHCNPFAINESDLHDLRDYLKEKRFCVMIETGARFLLDPFRKHEPTLVSSDHRAQRIDFLKRAIEIGVALDARGITFFSGIKKADVSDADAWKWLIDGCREICKFAQKCDIQLGFEPEPGMFIDDLSKYDELKSRLNCDALKLTLDIGHVACTEDAPIPDVIERYRDQIVSFHIEDIKDKVHNHLMFGEGDIHFYPVLKKIGELPNIPINVELSRHSHMAPLAAEQAINFLRDIVQS
jgi:sugar phosphate isomerase/epimerase